ncbi:MAG: biotin--[acetyl-CoA-carboxylase] ligase [Alphaproteobacteria bacterium]
MPRGNIRLDTYKLLSFDKISSTQDYAHDLIARGDAHNKTIIQALAQSAGRGRYRRTWVSHHGNLYASFIYKTTERDPKLSYAVAVAIAETLIALGMMPEIKWPNDVLIKGKKISGVLIEYSQSFVIIGIGINIKTCPTVKEYKTTKINNFVKDADINNVLGILIKEMDKWRKVNFLTVRERWMDLAAALNKVIQYHGKPAELIGLNEDGALVLRDGSRYILTYGDEISI